MVSRGQVTAPPPENRVSGMRPGTEAEDGAIAPNPNPAYCVPNGHPRIAHPGGQRIQIDGEWLPVRCGDPEPGDPGGEIGKLDHPAPAFGRVFDHPPGFARSARTAESTLTSVMAVRGGFHGRAIRRVPSVIRTLWNSTSGDLPPFEPFPMPSTSS